jgi:hypothetical protein
MRKKERHDRSAFYLWFGDHPETLAYNPVYLSHVPSNRLAQQWTWRREAMNKFDDPEHRRQLIETATREFNSHVANALQKIGK